MDLALTVLATVAAFFSAVAALATYRVASILAGRSNPIRIGRARMSGSHPIGDEIHATLDDSRQRSGIDITPTVRLCHVYAFNHADSRQHIVIDPLKSQIVWPRWFGDNLMHTREFDLEPHSGGIVPLHLYRLASPDDQRADGAQVVFPSPQRFWLRLRVVTNSGHKRHRLIPVHLQLLPSPTPNQAATAEADFEQLDQ